jgi:hypothetical protein
MIAVIAHAKGALDDDRDTARGPDISSESGCLCSFCQSAWDLSLLFNREPWCHSLRWTGFEGFFASFSPSRDPMAHRSLAYS